MSEIAYLSLCLSLSHRKILQVELYGWGLLKPGHHLFLLCAAIHGLLYKGWASALYSRHVLVLLPAAALELDLPLSGLFLSIEKCVYQM